MSSDFVHLHVHSDYSILDGACSIKKLLKTTTEMKMPAVAITDHGYMGGAVDFYQQFKQSPVKPLIGCELYVAPRSRFEKDANVQNIRGYHVVLLAATDEGYTNLCKLISDAHINGFYYNPRTDREFLAAHTKGLICLSACLKGEIPSAVLAGNMKEAKKITSEYRDMFGKENFYLEIMDHGIPEQTAANKGVISLAREFGIPLVATNDAHYIKKEHAKSHDIMLCIQTRSEYNDPNRLKFSTEEFYIKSGEEMAAIFKETPEAIKNTLEVAEKCNMAFPDKAKHYPVYKLPEGVKDERVYLKDLCVDGIKQRFNFDSRAESLTDDQKNIIKRMDYELGVIEKSGYVSYFLIVWDFINHARKTGVPVGPGRGSGAGSLVAYLTGITNIDPLRYNLLFERFLNPERVSAPDFDIDFCERRRTEVIDYVIGKYGKDNVAQIGTYGTLKPKAVVKDVVRVLGRSVADGEKITKLIPGDAKNLDDAVKKSAELKDLIEKEPWVREIFDLAEPIEGLNRNMTIHAAGVIIGDQRLDNLAPLARGAGEEVITQFNGPNCEKIGLLKMDFLGLKTLTIIRDTIEHIKLNQNKDIVIDNIPLDDPKTFALLNKGDTVGVFQLESGGMQDLCRKFGVERFEHISALNAIYRPGPMDFIPDFIARKMGRATIEYDHHTLENIISETYGIMLYQEQIMQAVQALAGFTLGGADILRRAISKKDEKKLQGMKADFLKGCGKVNNIPESKANEIWDKISRFADYGFNKSHSAAYSVLAYQTAYLKANYPVEFMAANLTSEIDNAEKLSFFINECRNMKIKILPPDVNRSNISFTVDKDSIRFGLGAIKGVGGAAAAAIMDARKKDGDFKTFPEFIERTSGGINARMIENMCMAGAFDSFGLKRSQVNAITAPCLVYASNKIKDAAAGQGSLFDLMDNSADFQTVEIPDIPETEETERLRREKELLGFYVTGHPLAKYEDIINLYSNVTAFQVGDLPDGSAVRIGGIIKSAQKKISKKNGKPFAIVQLENFTGTVECSVYEKAYEEFKDLIADEKAVFIEAAASKRDEAEKTRISADKIIPLDEARERYTKEIHIHVYEGSVSKKALADMLESLKKYSGAKNGTSLIICVKCVSGEIVFVEAGGLKLKVSESLLNEIESVLGENRCKLKPNKHVPRPRFNRGNFQKARQENGAPAAS